MITRKIARNGMRGRKKVTLLLTLVLIFTFLFITAAVLLETSMQKTRLDQREQLYGTWHAAYLDADGAQKQKFLAEGDITEAAVTELIGKDKKLGTVGTISEDLVRMGNLALTQGRLPENEQEIVLEENVADSLSLDSPVGGKIKLNMESILVSEDQMAYLTGQYENSSAENPMSAFRRQLSDYEQASDTLLLELNSEYSFAGSAASLEPEDIEANGLLYKQTLGISREYTVTGVVRSFSGFWDTGAFASPGLFVSEKEAAYLLDAIHGSSMMDLSGYEFHANIFARSDTRTEHLFDSLKEKYVTAEELAGGNDRTIAFRRNTYAYPDTDGNAEETLTALVILVIFVVAFCAILQIFLTQMKRRARKTALLKSIGTTNPQVCAILFWEGVYLLLYSLPIGVLLGFGTGFGAVWFLNQGMGMELSFYADPKMLLYGVLAGCAALFAGMLVPAVKALNVPLTGTVTAPTRKKRTTKRGLSRGRKGGKGPLTYPKIAAAHRRTNWKSQLMTGVITCVSGILVFTSLYLSYVSFSSYREQVTAVNRPNYELHALHWIDSMDGKAFGEELREISPESEILIYHQMNRVFLKYDGIEESPLVNAYKELLPKERYGEFIGAEPTIEEQKLLGADPKDYVPIYGSLGTTLYTIDTMDDCYDTIRGMVDTGRVDENAFVRGESVILVMPMYREMGKAAGGKTKIPDTVTEQQMFDYVLTKLGGFKFTYDSGLEKYYRKDTSVQPGDELQIYKWMEGLGGGPPVYNELTARVDGIIYTTGDSPVYPFLAENNGITILASNSFLNRISWGAMFNPMKAGVDLNAKEEQFSFALSQYPTMYGETHVNVYTDDGARAVEPAAQVARLGKSYGMSFSNYNEENWNLYYRALNNAMILGILGGTSLLLALLILWNIQMSAFEQERQRLGVLQALGVTNHVIAADYWKTGLLQAAISLAAAHAVLFGVILLAQDGVLYLKDYPWAAHTAIGAAYFVLTALVSAAPARKLGKYAPVENISA